MTTLTGNRTYTVEQCQQMIARFTQELNDAIADYTVSYVDSRGRAYQALMVWQRHLKDAYARQEFRRTKYDNGISGHYHD